MSVSLAGASRLSLVVPLAAAVTIALFILMQILIRTDLIAIDPPQDRPRIAIAEYVPPVEIDRTPPEITDPVPPPELPDLRIRIDQPGSLGQGVPTGPIMIDTPVIDPFDEAGIQFQHDPGPLVRVEPVYPARMLDRGVEGRCTLRFDVLGSGQTANVELLGCDSGFERASLSAVYDWRYSASDRVAAGEIAVRGLTTVLEYKLD